MKKLFLYGGFGLAIGLSCCVLQAASIIKTNTGDLSYFDQLQIFRRGQDDTVRGWVRLNRGFAVASRASAFMDTFITVSGPMDLGETGTLVLNGNLFLDNSVTLTSGGFIRGRTAMGSATSTIFLGGDLTLAATTYTRVIHITGDFLNGDNAGDLIIDGMGHTLDIQDRTQIFVDTNLTLTLRNMTIRTGPKSLRTPPIFLSSMTSKLALDNVIFDLGADLQFKQGQLFIHDNVSVTGTSAFIYQSPKPSFITSGATWSFDEGTTLSVAPATFTDCPFALKRTYTSSNFIVLSDASSAICFNGCSVKTTFTGVRYTKGMVLFDNQVPVDTAAGLALDSTTPISSIGTTPTGSTPYALSWSPNGQFLAVVNYGINTLQIFRANQTAAPTPLFTVSTGVNPAAVAWSPDGRFLAVLNYYHFGGGDTLQVYRFTGNSSPKPIGGPVVVGTNPTSVSWSPDGRFLAVAYSSAGSTGLTLYRFSGACAPTVFCAVPTVSSVQSVAWSPDGRYFVATLIAGYSGFQVYRFDGRNVPTAVGIGAPTAGINGWGVAWSPDGRFLIGVSYSGANGMYAYFFSGSSTPATVGTVVTTMSNPNSVDWSPDGRYFAVTNYTSGTGQLQLYRCDGTKTPDTVGSLLSLSAAYPRSVRWSPDGQLLAVVYENAALLEVFRCNYVYSGQPAQAFSTGLVFGDSAKGSNFDATVKIMGNARVGIKGKVTDDSA